jgi:PAS domain S-box-containing protein
MFMKDEKIERLEKLSKVSREIMGNLEGLPLDQRLLLIARHAADILDAEASGILLVKRTGFLCFEAGAGYFNQESLKGQEFAICNGPNSGLTGYIAHEGKLFNAHGDELTHHFAVRGEKARHLPSGECHSLLAIPLKKKDQAGEKLVGLIRVDNKKAGDGQSASSLRFSEVDEWILSIFAEASVAALENAEVVGLMREQKDRLAGLVASSPNGIIAFNRDGKVTLFNEQAERITGYKAHEVIDKPLNWLDTVHSPCDLGNLIPSNGGGRRLAQYESLVKNKAGESLLLRHTSSWLYDAAGECSGSVGYFEDLRLLKKAEKQHKLLLEATKLVAQASSLREGMRNLTQLMASILPHTFCRILLLDETRQVLEVSAACRLRERVKGGTGLHHPITLREWPGLLNLVQNNEPVLLRSSDPEYTSTLKRLSNLIELESGIRTLLLVPLKLKHRVVGLLEFGEVLSEELRPFTDDEIDFCAAIAARVSILIDRMHMHDLTRRSEQRHKTLHETLLHLRAIRGKQTLLPELVRMAAKLVGCGAAGLFVNHPQSKELELEALHGLPRKFLNRRISFHDGVIGQAARAGKPVIEHNYAGRTDSASIFRAQKFKGLIAAPLRNEAGEVEAVLFVADSTGKRRFLKTDLEAMGSLAEHASLEMQTSRLLTQEQRTLSKLNTLHKFSTYIQAEEDLNRILHVVLTGVTADYGLRCNRAALLFLDKKGKTLVGQIGIGNLRGEAAMSDWERDERQGLKDLDSYLAMLDTLPELPTTPVDHIIKQLRVPVNDQAPDVFSKAIAERRPILLTREELAALPKEFTSTFEPALPCVVIPLKARNQVIGILVADNKFTRVALGEDDVNLLHTFANGTATAIDNRRLLNQTQAELELYEALCESSISLSSGANPLSILQQVVNQPPPAAAAAWVRVILIDEASRPWRQIIGDGGVAEFPLSDAIRPEGISVQVLRSGKAVVVEDVNDQLERMNPFILNQGIRAALCLPLSRQGKTIGVMWINYDRPRRFQDFEIQGLQLYANLAAITYNKAREMEESERLHRAAEAMSGASDLKQVLQTIVSEASDMFHADSCSIWSYDYVRDKFLPDELEATGLRGRDLQTFKDLEPAHEGTIYAILERGWIGVPDTADPPPHVLRKQIQEHLLQIGVKSFQGIALQVGDEDSPTGDNPTGVLYLNYTQPRVFSDEDRRSFKNFATYAALALKKARLLDQVKRTNSVAEVVARVSALEEDPNATLHSVVEGTSTAVGCDAVVLYAYDEIKNKWHYPPVHAGVTLPEAAWPSDRVPGGSVVYKIFRMKEPYYIAEKGTEDKLGLLKGRFAREEKIVSCLALPLQAAGRSVGVMFVNYRSRNRFASDDLNNIRLFANQAAVAIRNFQLFQESRKKLAEQETLVKLSQSLLGTVTLQETFDRAVSVAAQVLDVKHCNIVLRSKNGKLMLAAAVGWERELVGNYELADDTGSQTGFTIMTGGPVIVDDIDKEERFDVLQIVREQGVKSSMSVPMFREGEIIGAMLVHTKNYHQFTEAEVNLLSLVANQTAIVVQSAQRFEDLKLTKGLVGARTALAWMGMASSNWGHAVNGKAIIIRDRVKLLNRTLRKNAPGSISDELLAMVEKRSAAIEEIAAEILSKIITPPLSEANVHSVLIDVLVCERIKQLWTKDSYNAYPFPITASAGSGVSVRINEFWFNQALDYLIDNALKAMAASAIKRLSIDIRRRNAAVEISITDTGKGIPPDVLPLLFNEQIKKEPGSEGLGMGLMMVQCIVEAYRGEVKVESTGPNGTTMVIRLPVEIDERECAGAADDFLLIGDSLDRHWRDILEEILSPLGHLEIVGEQMAVESLSERSRRAVIIDAGAVDNFALLTSRLRTHYPDARIIVVTASPSWKFAREAFRAGATDYLRKSVNRQELSLTLEQALAKPLLRWPHYCSKPLGEECHVNTYADSR